MKDPMNLEAVNHRNERSEGRNQKDIMIDAVK